MWSPFPPPVSVATGCTLVEKPGIGVGIYAIRCQRVHAGYNVYRAPEMLLQTGVSRVGVANALAMMVGISR